MKFGLRNFHPAIAAILRIGSKRGRRLRKVLRSIFEVVYLFQAKNSILKGSNHGVPTNVHLPGEGRLKSKGMA